MKYYLDPVEAIMWRAGRETGLRMTVGNLMVLGRPLTRAELVGRVAGVAERAPRLRWHPDGGGGTRIRPHWVDDDSAFDPEQHVRTIAVPSPGDQRQVLDLVALLEAVPFATNRPPWDVTLIDGVEGGRAALYLRTHHVVCDGMGGIWLTRLLLDDTGRGSTVEDEVVAATAMPADAEPVAASPSHRRRRGTVSIELDVRDVVRPLATGVNAALSADPVGSAFRRLQQGVDLIHSVSHQVVLDRSLAPNPPSDSGINHFEVASVPGARSAALALGGSRNDLLVAVAATTLGRYYDRLGPPRSELRLATPTIRPRDGAAVGNWFAPLRVEIPTTWAHPGPHFGVVASRLARARSEPALGLTGPIALALSRLPDRLLLPIIRTQSSSIDFMATALAGRRRPQRLAGAAVEASYPFGPRLACPVNFTAHGNEDRLDVGISLDPDAITDHDALLECLDEALDDFTLQRAASSRPINVGPPPDGDHLVGS